MSYEKFFYIYKKHGYGILKYYDRVLFIIKNMRNLYKKLTWYEIILLYIKWSLKIIIVPFIYIVNYQKKKYVKNYKQGIQGFRNNPMYTLIDKPQFKKDWKWKLHTILVTHKISYFLKHWRKHENTILEYFLKFKMAEVKWTNKNLYQDHFWKRWYYWFKVTKRSILDFLIDKFTIIEDTYIMFETALEMKNWSLWKRCKYAYHMYMLYRYAGDPNYVKNEQRISRRVLFYNRTKERRKLRFIYFVKGIINWLTYVTINKVVFTKIKGIKPKHVKSKRYKYVNYKIVKLDSIYHLGSYIESVPPQFWSLVIVYENYYRIIVRYIYQSPAYPFVKWEDYYQNRKEYKWLLGSNPYTAEVDYIDKKYIATEENNLDYSEIALHLDTKPYDPILRWILFLFEYGFCYEDMKNFSENIWVDVSMTHLLTYNKALDLYNFEIKEFEGKLQDNILFYKRAMFNLEKEKRKYEDDLYDLIKTNVEEKANNILPRILKKRHERTINVLAKGLANYEILNEDQKAFKKEQQKTLDYFFHKRSEFFESQGFSESMEVWKASKYTLHAEEKYYDIKRLEGTKINIINALKSCEDKDLDYTETYILSTLEDKFYVMCFDETLEEIISFLNIRIWKDLNKRLNKQNKKKNINYKHINIPYNSILPKINWDNPLINFSKKKYKNPYTIYEKAYNNQDIVFKELLCEPVYNRIANHLIYTYTIHGELITYSEKIKFNEKAKYFKRLSPYEDFHKNHKIFSWMNRISKEKVTLNYLRLNTKKKKKKWQDFINIISINNIKWTWAQWLGYADTTKEDTLLQNNIIVLNEKYRIWGVKRGPIRVKLPIELMVKSTFFKNWLLKSEFGNLEQRHFLLSSAMRPILKASLIWEVERKDIEARYGKPMKEIIEYVLKEGGKMGAEKQMADDYAYFMRSFIKSFRIFSKLYFVGMTNYSWDLIRYWDLWAGMDEYNKYIDQFYRLKQEEYIMHDPIAHMYLERLDHMIWVKYDPSNYYRFFNWQFRSYESYIYKIISIICVIWFLKIIIFWPGFYLRELFVLWTPITLCMYSWYLRKLLKDSKQIKAGKELYLYEFHVTKKLSKKQKKEYAKEWEDDRYEWVNIYYTDAEQKEVFGEKGPIYKWQLDEIWWKRRSHLTPYNSRAQYEHIMLVLKFIFVWWIVEWFGMYQFKYRNHWIWWDYFRYDEELLERVKKELPPEERPPLTYHDKNWTYDSWTRIESGGNIFSRWYENKYRAWQNRPFLELDYGHPFQKAFVKAKVPLDFQKGAKSITVHIGYADAEWFYFAFVSNLYIPDDVKRYKYFKNYFKRSHKLKYEDIVELNKTSFVSEDEMLEFASWREKYEIDYIGQFLFKIKYFFYDWIIGNIAGDKHKPSYTPVKAWFKFKKKMIDWYNYDINAHPWGNFVFDMKKKMAYILRLDQRRYEYKGDYNFKFFDYRKDFFEVKEKKPYNINFLQNKINAFKNESTLDVRSLVNISNEEKHLYVIYYNLSNYKVDRLIYFLTDMKGNKDWMFVVPPRHIYVWRYNKKLDRREDHIYDVWAIKGKPKDFIEAAENYLSLWLDIDEGYRQYAAELEDNALNKIPPTEPFMFFWKKTNMYYEINNYNLNFVVETGKAISEDMKNADILLYHNERVQSMWDHAYEVELYSKKCEVFINNIFKKVPSISKIESKYDLFMSVWKDDYFSIKIIKEIFNNLDFFEFFELLIKIIISIFF